MRKLSKDLIQNLDFQIIENFNGQDYGKPYKIYGYKIILNVFLFLDFILKNIEN